MFNSTIIDVAIGTILSFLALSLAASAITEAIASAQKWRHETLLQGVRALVNDPDFTGIAKQLYGHALIHPLGSGDATDQRSQDTIPAYIDPKQFATAFMDVCRITGDGPPTIAGNPQLNDWIRGLYARAGGRLGPIHQEIAGWFDGAMDRVSGWYKRRAQRMSFIVALVVAAGLNVDAINVTQTLWNRPALLSEGVVTQLATRSLSQAGSQPGGEQSGVGVNSVITALDSAGSLIGWNGFISGTDPRYSTHGVVMMVLGWLVSAGASLFGAPFWFDLLQRIVKVRGTGRGIGTIDPAAS